MWKSVRLSKTAKEYLAELKRYYGERDFAGSEDLELTGGYVINRAARDIQSEVDADLVEFFRELAAEKLAPVSDEDLEAGSTRYNLDKGVLDLIEGMRADLPDAWGVGYITIPYCIVLILKGAVRKKREAEGL
jgi:hypothetical protein